MKITPNTLNIIKSFATAPFMSSLVIPGGNILSTMEETRTVIAIAEVEDVFPVEAMIYNAPQFLSVVSLIADPDFEWEANHVTITSEQNHQRVTWRYGARELLHSIPPTSFTPFDSVATFTLGKDSLNAALRAAAVLEHESIVISHDDRGITLTTIDNRIVNNNATDGSVQGAVAYQQLVSDQRISETDWSFEYATKRLGAVIPTEYTVDISRKGGVQLKSSGDFNITYRIGQNAQRNR